MRRIGILARPKTVSERDSFQKENKEGPIGYAEARRLGVPDIQPKCSARPAMLDPAGSRYPEGRHLNVAAVALNCRICGKPIVLVPSARKREARYGGRPQNYTVLFREHTECALLKRERETAELMRKINQEYWRTHANSTVLCRNHRVARADNR